MKRLISKICRFLLWEEGEVGGEGDGWEAEGSGGLRAPLRSEKVCAWVRIYVSVYTCMCVHTHVYMCIRVCTHEHVYAC